MPLIERSATVYTWLHYYHFNYSWIDNGLVRFILAIFHCQRQIIRMFTISARLIRELTPPGPTMNTINCRGGIDKKNRTPESYWLDRWGGMGGRYCDEEIGVGNAETLAKLRRRGYLNIKVLMDCCSAHWKIAFYKSRARLKNGYAVNGVRVLHFNNVLLPF